MGKQKKFAKSPLLYIHQPDISHPNAPMQSNYKTPRNKMETETPKAQKTYTRPLKRNDFSKMLHSKSEQKTEETPTEPEATSNKDEEQSKLQQSNKKFNEMTIQEKIDYFLSKPKHLPTMKCEVKTEERSFRGTIQGVEKDQLLMRVGRRSGTTEIAIESIKDIKLLGF